MIKLSIYLVLGIVLMAGFASAALQDSLVAYWNFSNGRDLGPTGVYNLTTINGAGYLAGGIIGMAGNMSNGSAALNSATYFNVSNSTLAFNFGAGEFSFFGWSIINSSKSGSDAYLLSKHQDGGAGGWYILKNSTNNLLWFDDNGNRIGTTTIKTPFNQWFSWAITRNSTNICVYINGTFAGCGGTPSPPSSSHPIEIGDDDNTNNNGYIDELGIWLRDLEPSEVAQLHNNYSGLTYNGTSFVTNGSEGLQTILQVQLISPSNAAMTTATTINFTANYTVQSFNMTNATYYFWNSTDFIYNRTTRTVTGSSMNSTTLQLFNISTNNYEWNVLLCGLNNTGHSCSFASSNFTFSIQPFEELSTIFNTSVLETSRQNFRVSLNTLPSVSAVSANLYYNGTRYTSTVVSQGSGVYNLSNAIDIPLTTIPNNKSFFWELMITQTDGAMFFRNTTLRNQSVERTYLQLCNGTVTTQFINFTTVSATSPYPRVNSSFESTWSWFVAGAGGTVSRNTSYENLNVTNSTYTFCMIPRHESFEVSSTLEYVAPNYVQNYYYLEDALLSNSTTAIDLFLLNDSLATVTVLRVRNAAQNPISDIIITIQQYNVGTGIYSTIGMAKTASNGEDIAYLNWYDSIYKFILTKNSTVLDSTTPERISATPRTFIIQDEPTYPFDKFRDFEYSLTFNNVTKLFTLTFIKPSGDVDQGCLRVIKRGPTNDTLLSLVCDTSSSATLFYSAANDGNGTFIAAFYATGSWDLIDWISAQVGGSLAASIYDLLGKDDAAFYAFTFGALIVCFFAINAIFGVIGAILGVIAAGAMGFTPLDYGIMCFMAVIGGAIIWLIKR